MLNYYDVVLLLVALSYFFRHYLGAL